jgi:hypothetical protein
VERIDMAYLPTHSKPISEIPFQQIRLGIQGAPGEGKTYASLNGWPGPIVVADFDNKLGVHKDRTDVRVLPFWSARFINEDLKINNAPFSNGYIGKTTRGGVGKPDPKLPPNRRDALTWWLSTEGQKLENDQTLILDSWTSLQAAFDQQTEIEPEVGRDGKVNEFAFWMAKIDWSADVCSLLKSLNCHVICTFHEMPQRDPKSGMLLEKIQPLMQGKFTTQIASHFTDFFRQIAVPRYNRKGEEVKLHVPGNRSYSLSKDVEYFWQITSDDEFSATSTLTKADGAKYVPAEYGSFLKYRI